MLQALGYGLLDEKGNPIPLGAKGLQKLCTITDDSVLPALKECSFQIACDVTNTLCGAQGCSAVFGPQKGADAAMIAQMDQWLAQYAALTAQKYPHADANQAGTGAAGGLGFAFVSYMNAVLEPGGQYRIKRNQLGKRYPYSRPRCHRRGTAGRSDDTWKGTNWRCRHRPKNMAKMCPSYFRYSFSCACN